MNLSKHTGIKISQYPTALVNTTNRKNKLRYDHYLMSYADTNFGISTIQKNYKVPVDLLREDFKSYVGLENAKGNWQNQIKIWNGEWKDNKNNYNSYVYQYTEQEIGQDNYIENKHGLADDGFDRIFIVKNAPIPCEFTIDNIDPNTDTTKLVDKKYIDDRFNGIRVVNVSDNTLQIRPYSCLYQYENEVNEIDIVDTLDCGDGRTTKESLLENFVVFYIMLPAPSSADINFKVKANGKENNFRWGFGHECINLFATAYNRKQNIYLKCHCHYINDELFVSCTSAFNYEPGSSVTDVIVDEIENSPDTTPSSRLFYKHINSQYDDIIESYGGNLNDIHVSKSDRETWNDHFNSNIHITNEERTNWDNKVSSIDSDDYLTINENEIDNTVYTISVNTTSDRITEDTDKTLLPTVDAILAHENDSSIHIKDTERTNWNNKVDSVSVDGVYIKNDGDSKNIELSLNVTNEISDDEVKIPTSQAVVDYVQENKGVPGIEYDSTQQLSNKFRFLGKYVNVIDNNGVIELYFGPNDNPPEMSNFTNPKSNNRYIYKSNDNSWSLPSNCETNSTYEYTSNADSQIFTLLGEKNNEEMTLFKEGFIQFGVYKNGKLLDNSVMKIIINGDKGNINSENEFIIVDITNVVKNDATNPEHEQYTPNSIRYKCKVTVKQSKILGGTNGASYSVAAITNSLLPQLLDDAQTKSKEVFIYNSNSTKTPSVDFSSYSYSNDKTVTVSGITYDNNPSIIIELKDIENTEIASTENLNRAKISLSDSDSEGCSFDKSIILTKNQIVLQNGLENSDTAIYKSKSQTEIKISTNNDVAKLNTKITIGAYGCNGYNVTKESEQIESDNYIYTYNELNDTDLISRFIVDGSYRKLGYINESTMKLVLVGNGAYDNASTLNATNYDKQLLIQGGKLKHPKNDKTETYKNLGGKRYYIRSIKFEGSDRIYTFKIKFNSGIENPFPTGVRMFLAKDQTSDIQELTAAKNKGHNGCSESDNPSNGTWTVAPAGKFEVMGGTPYYFIIEIDETATAELGTLTITQ